MDPNKSLLEQLPKNQQNHTNPRLKFRVRFYPPDPQRLKEESSRHWLYLQMRADMLAGLLDASDDASAELAAYAAQVKSTKPLSRLFSSLVFNPKQFFDRTCIFSTKPYF